MCAKIIAVIRDRANGDAVASEDVNFRNPALTILDTDTTGADGSATYLANANPAGLINWDASVSGETRKAGARAQRQIGPLFEAELAKSFKGIMSNGYSEGDGSECAVIPGSGRQVTVGTGCLWVEGIPFHFYTTTNLASSANPGTFATRLDRVILRVKLNDGATDYGMGTLVYLEGTINNTLPSITQDESGTYEYVLANVTSASGFSSYTVGNISDQQAQAGPNAVPVASLPTGIPATSIGDGSVTNAEFQTLSDASTITTIQAQLNLKSPLASPTFTGTPVLPGFSLTGNISANGQTVTPSDLGFLSNLVDDIQVQLNNKSAVGHGHAQADITGLAASLSAKADTSAVTSALALKANLAGGAAFTGNLVAQSGFHHTGGTWGFNDSSVSGTLDDPDDIPSGTIDVTWGTTEAAILEQLRASFNQLVTQLRLAGILSA